jgi:hypothetical protein
MTLRCAVCGKEPDLIVCEDHGADFACDCNTPSRLKRAWYWLKARWINFRLPKPRPEPEDWDPYIKPWKQHHD